MGQIKQLLPLGESTVIRRCIHSIILSGIKDIIVVIGPFHEEIKREIESLPVRITVNKIPESEMAESVRVGLKMIEGTPTGVLIYPSDHPLVSPDTLKKLLDTHVEDPGMILIPCWNGKRGHPTLFPATVLRDVFTGLNLREVIKKNPQKVRYINVADEGVVLDMDMIDDYKEMLKRVL